MYTPFLKITHIQIQVNLEKKKVNRGINYNFTNMPILNREVLIQKVSNVEIQIH